MRDDLIDISGSCYCGAVRYRARNAKPEVTECHCTQCRKQTGHRFATTATEMSNITVDGADSITWFRTSPEAERGFCAVCGSTLFWKMSKRDYSGILAASVDEPNGLHLNKHIFVDDKGGYYEITDGMPQYEGYEKLVTEN